MERNNLYKDMENHAVYKREQEIAQVTDYIKINKVE